VTNTSATIRLASRLGVTQLVVVEDAGHEIVIERDDLRASFWVAFDRFVTGSASKSFPPEMTSGAA